MFPAEFDFIRNLFTPFTGQSACERIIEHGIGAIAFIGPEYRDPEGGIGDVFDQGFHGFGYRLIVSVKLFTLVHMESAK
jgi:hypothetical protein